MKKDWAITILGFHDNYTHLLDVIMEDKINIIEKNMFFDKLYESRQILSNLNHQKKQGKSG